MPTLGINSTFSFLLYKKSTEPSSQLSFLLALPSDRRSGLCLATFLYPSKAGLAEIDGFTLNEIYAVIFRQVLKNTMQVLCS